MQDVLNLTKYEYIPYIFSLKFKLNFSKYSKTLIYFEL